MGLILSEKDARLLKKIAQRERAPYYVVGKVTGDKHFSFVSNVRGEKPIDLSINSLFGDTPKTNLFDEKKKIEFDNPTYDFSNF